MEPSVDSAAESRSLCDTAENMLRSNDSEYMFERLNGRFIDGVAQALADDPSRQEEYRLLDQKGIPSGESLELLSEISAWSGISNGKTLAVISEQHEQWLAYVSAMPEDYKAAY
ncbi:hypothetical protein B9479_004286 [Cryptococcus floricola]|uniref:Uncharacterized protein n=1 Tax=Cryptococcus floricola TaxID=2591691 RepID=A0A5D3AW29_9TREE|nr:hypothetical protein B9479_004286 [Cryptococcus floricola]